MAETEGFESSEQVSVLRFSRLVHEAVLGGVECVRPIIRLQFDVTQNPSDSASSSRRLDVDVFVNTDLR